MFKNGFGRFVCEGDTITCEVDGFLATAQIYADDDNSPPWERGDGHGEVSDWQGRYDGETLSKGWVVLCTDRSSFRAYDMAGAVRKALADGWGMPGGRLKGERKRAYAVRAAQHDFEVLKAWCDDEWRYVGVAVTVSREGVRLTGNFDHALWGVDCNYPGSDNSYLTEVANEQLPEALAAARAKVVSLGDETLHAIQKLLDGVEWSADTCDAIAEVLRSAGYEVRDVADMADDEVVS